MSADLTETLAAWKTTADAATEGPWYQGDIGEFAHQVYAGDGLSDDVLVADDTRLEADAEFIAQSRTIVPALLSAVENVLARHQQDKCGDCTECSPVDYGIAWPCLTVKTITAALGGSR